MSCDSWDTNASFDYLPRPLPGDHMNPVKAYLGDNIEKYLTHPYASRELPHAGSFVNIADGGFPKALFADLKGLPPLLIQCGDAEVLRDEGTLLAHKASSAGVSVRHELYEDCVHVFQAFLFLDASRKALQSARHFMRTALDKRGRIISGVSDKARNEIDREMRRNMGNTKGEKVEPRTGEAEGSVRSHSDPEDQTSDDQEEWEMDKGAERAAGKTAQGVFGAVEKALQVDDQMVTDATDRGVEEASGQTSSAASMTSRRSRTQPSSPMAYRTSSSASQPAAASSAAPSFSSHHKRRSTHSISLEEARAAADAGMRANSLSGQTPSGKFHEGKPPSAPRLSNRRTTSSVELDQLIKSFESKPAMKTARWAAD